MQTKKIATLHNKDTVHTSPRPFMYDPVLRVDDDTAFPSILTLPSPLRLLFPYPNGERSPDT